MRSGPERIRELVNLGAHFDLAGDAATDFDLTREGGHSRRRIIHAHDMTGQEVESILVARVLEQPNITVFENQIAVDLITRHKLFRRGAVTTNAVEYCLGVYVLDTATGQVNTFIAPIILLATGGAGKVYLYTSNPDIATGDGVAMAYRAGANIANMEFIQFHPTCLYPPPGQIFPHLRSGPRRRRDSAWINTAPPSWRNTTPSRTWPSGTSWPGPSTPS